MTNYALLEFCKLQKITFTRSRPYKKNDQAHVEEKNGSIVRKIIGYDRYEGLDAYNALSNLYAVLRLYINFFQPSLKLVSKKREGAKVTKKYDVAKTPYQRILASTYVSEEAKQKIKEQYNNLDPLKLLMDLEKLQDNFWKYAWKSNSADTSISIEKKVDFAVNKLPFTHDNINSKNYAEEADKISDIISNENCKEKDIVKKVKSEDNDCTIRRYRRSNKPRKNMGPRTWRSRKDPLQNVWGGIQTQLELNPCRTSKSLLDDLIDNSPEKLNVNVLRTLQRRVADWRLQQVKIKQEINSQKIFKKDDAIGVYASLVGQAVIG